jgi:hypothetical protein
MTTCHIARIVLPWAAMSGSTAAKAAAAAPRPCNRAGGGLERRTFKGLRCSGRLRPGDPGRIRPAPGEGRSARGVSTAPRMPAESALSNRGRTGEEQVAFGLTCLT